MSTLSAVRPLVRFREGRRGFELHVGPLVLSQSTYLLAGAMAVGLGGGFGAIAFRALIGYEQGFAFGIALPRLAGFVPHAVALVAVVAAGGAIAAFIAARFAPSSSLALEPVVRRQERHERNAARER